MNYLLEIRRRLIWVSGCYALFFLVFFYWQSAMLSWFLQPLQHVLKKNDFIVATQVASPVLAPLHLASNAALWCGLPFFLFHLWQFLKPALYVKESHWVKWITLTSVLLFIAGSGFCFWVVLPFMFELFVSMTPHSVHYFPELGASVLFILHMLILFGVCFQIPLISVILVRSRLITFSALKSARPYVIVVAFIIGMLLTPPDVGSQILLAVPLCLLYEAGLFFLYLTSA